MSASQPNNRRLMKAVCKAGILFCTLAGVLAFMRYFEVQGILEYSWADTHLKNQRWLGVGLYIALVGTLAALAVPRQALATLGGYAFGATWGCVWVTVGLTIGCACTFFYARLLGRSALQRRFGKRIQKFNDFLSHKPFLMIIAVRSFPLGSNTLTNLLGGITNIPALPFIAGSCVGYLPLNLIFALLGGGLRIDAFWPTLVSGILFLLSSAFGYILYRRSSAARGTIEDDIADTANESNPDTSAS